MKKFITISNTAELMYIAPENIVFIEAEGNYSKITRANNTNYTFTIQLGQIEEMINSQLGTEGNIFIRIGRSYIINRAYIHQIHLTQKELVLSDARNFSHKLTASKDALKLLKELMDKENK